MSIVADSVTDYLEQIHSNRALLSRMYSEGYIVRDEDNSRKLNQLLQIRAIRVNPGVQDTYRVSPTLGRLFDEVTHKSRSYGVSADFAESMGVIIKLMDDYSNAHFEGRDDDCDSIMSQYDFELFSMADSMNEFLLLVRTAVENNFGNVRTYKEKEKQNQHYLDQLTRIKAALESFDAPALLHELETPEREPLFDLYERHILAHTAGWRSANTDITSVLRVYLHKLRAIQPRARRIRAFQMHLRRNPAFEIREPEEYPEIPDWAYQHEPMKIQLEVDLGREDVRDALVEVAKSIESTVATPPVDRSPGRLVREDAPKAAIIKGSPLVVVTQRLLNEAARTQTPISAATYFANAPETMEYDQESCMLCFLNLLEKQIRAGAGIVRRLHVSEVAKNESDRLSGNVVIEDVHLCKRA